MKTFRPFKAKKIKYALSINELSFLKEFSLALSEILFEALKYEWPAGLIRHFLSQQFQYGFAALRSATQSIIYYCLEWLSAADRNLGMNRAFFREAFPNGQIPMNFMYPEGRLGEYEKVEEDLKHLDALMGALFAIETDSREEAIIRSCLGIEKVLIFSARVDVAESLFRRCLLEGFRVGMIHSRRSAMSGIGDVDPDEIVSRFRETKDAIRVLIATDCLSEGISFPECSNIIMVDIPDTAVKIEQRIGRVTRINSLSEKSKVFALKATNLVGSRSNFAKEKSEKSTRLGFQYALASNLLGEQKSTEDPFSALLECRDILAGLELGDLGLFPMTGKQFVCSGGTEISSLTLVRFFEGERHFSFHWLAKVHGRLTTRWTDIREPLLRMSRSSNELEEEKVSITRNEICHFDTLINRRNLSRFRPAGKRRDDSLSQRLAKKVSGFAVSDEEKQHLNEVLYSPFSRGRRLYLESIGGRDAAFILKVLLGMKVWRVSKLNYEVVFRVRIEREYL